MQIITKTDVLKQIAETKPGTIHTLQYLCTEKPKGLRAFYRISTFQVRMCDYEAMKKVITYRETSGLCANNPATQNEEKTDVMGVYFNTKTMCLKLRVPLNGCNKIASKYFVDGMETSKELYYAKWTQLGFALPCPAKSKSGVEFRAFKLDNIVYFK